MSLSPVAVSLILFIAATVSLAAVYGVQLSVQRLVRVRAKGA